MVRIESTSTSRLLAVPSRLASLPAYPGTGPRPSAQHLVDDQILGRGKREWTSPGAAVM